MKARHGIELERAYERLQQVRQLTGFGLNSDRILAAAWARYFEQVGQPHRARVETDYLAAMRHIPNVGWLDTRLDYATHIHFAVKASFCLLTCVLALTCLGRSRDVLRPANGRAAGPLTFTLRATAGAAALTVAIRYLVVLLRVEQVSQIPVSQSLLPFLAVGVSAAVFPGTYSGLSSPERRALAVATLPVVASALSVHLFFISLNGLNGMHEVWGDALGHPQVTSQLERRLEHGYEGFRFAAAASHHLAGDRARAEALYRALPGDRRARENLDALLRGDPTPPVIPSCVELHRAYASPDSRRLLRRQLPAAGVLVMFGLALGLALWLRASGVAAPVALARGAGNRAALWLSALIPGMIAWRRGAPMRAWLIASGFGFAAFSLYRCWYHGLMVQAPGGATGGHQTLDALPLPFQLNQQLSLWQLFRSSDLFWSYPYAGTYWTLVAVAGGLAIAGQLVDLWVAVRRAGR